MQTPLASQAFPLSEAIHSHIRELTAYEPGKPIEELAREMGIAAEQILKLASNENPLGPSPRALEAMHKALERGHFYPDGGGYFLREAIAQKLHLQRENVVLGNGSNEIIELVGHAFLSAGDEIITPRHAFAVYSLMAQLFGAQTVEVADPQFRCDLDALLAAITPKTRLIFIANPNNPTGTLVSQGEIDRFLEQVPSRVLVIFDEAYYEFVEDPPDVLQYVREDKNVRKNIQNVLVMRTFSKAQGLANLRIGYGLMPASLAEILHRVRQPFNTNGIAQAGALAALHDEEHLQATRRVTSAGKETLQNEFTALGLEFVPSHANFILVRVGDGDRVFQALLQRGIIVRAMRSYQLPEWIRVSIGTPAQNQRFLDALRQVL